MKKIIKAIAVAVAGVLAVTACAGEEKRDVKESTMETSKEVKDKPSSEETESSTSEEFFPGEINEGVYVNKVLGIQFDANANGMTLADDNSLSKINKGITDRSDIKAVKENIEKYNLFLDMFAYKEGYKETVGISIINGKNIKDEEEYFNITILENEKNGKAKVERSTGNFLGREVTCLLFKEEIDGEIQYQKHAAIKVGDYIASIVAKGGDHETVERELEMFTKAGEDGAIDKSEDAHTAAEEKIDEEENIKSEDTKEESTVDPDKTFVPGEMNDGVYTNKMFGVKLDGEANSMEFTGRQELNPKFYTDGSLNVEAVRTGLENGNKFIDMSANGPKNGCYVTIEKTALKDIDSYMDSAVSGLKAGYEEEGFNVNIEKSSVNFIGKDMPCISIAANFEDSTIYQKLVFLKSEDYIYSVASFGENEAFATAGLGMFTKLGD